MLIRVYKRRGKKPKRNKLHHVRTADVHNSICCAHNAGLFTTLQYMHAVRYSCRVAEFYIKRDLGDDKNGTQGRSDRENTAANMSAPECG